MILSCHQYTTPRGAAHLPEGADPEPAVKDPDPMNLDPQHRIAFLLTATYCQTAPNLRFSCHSQV
jgi:hypothetical protein